MQLLVIGGSRFVGYYIVEAALRNGHTVTMFNRGQSNPGIFPDVEEVVGDRDGDLHLLSNRRWDAVIDTCGYFPRIVGASAAALKDVVGLYCFISTISVYDADDADMITEESPLGTIEDKTVEDISGGNYGPLKVLCERAVDQHFAGRNLIIRPGLIVGPRDSRPRLNYWIQRMYQGGKVLVPNDPPAVTQLIDVRDLGDWTIKMVETHKTGIYNAVGPRDPLLFSDAIMTIHKAIGSNAQLTWIDAMFLLERGVVPWEGIPFWVPSEHNGLMKTSAAKAIADGLRYRSLEDTARNTLQWLMEQPDFALANWRPTLMPTARETELLELWLGSQADELQ